MKRTTLAIASAALLCTGCGTFQLGYVQPAQGQTREKMQLDMLTCKDEAHMAASTTGDAVKGFLLGLTIVGTPAAYAMDRQKQRDYYSKCMRDRGYAYTAPAD